MSVLCFVRDRDGDESREQDLEEGIEEAAAMFPMLRVIGGMAIEETEAWILALLGERRSERHADAKAYLKQNHGISTREGMVVVVEAADLDAVPDDAESLGVWLKRARDGLE